MIGLPVGLLGVAWPAMRAELGLPLDEMGLLLFTTTAGYIVSSFFIARLINRFGIGTLLVFSSLLSMTAYYSYCFAPTWPIIVAIGTFAGFGSGVIDAGLNTYLAAKYKESEMQWLHAFFGLGASFSPLIMTVSLARFHSWRPGYFFVGILITMLAVIFTLTRSAWKTAQTINYSPEGHIEDTPNMMDYKTSIWGSLRHLNVWTGIFLFMIFTGAEFTLGNWTYSVFTEGRGISPQIAGIWASGFWVTFTIGRVIAGLFAHRIRLGTLLIAAMSLSLAGSVLFWLNPFPLAGVYGVFIIGFGMAPIFPGLVSGTRQRVGIRHAANAIGFQMSSANLGGWILPALAGFLAQRISLESIPPLLTASLLGLIILYIFSLRKYGSTKGTSGVGG